MNDIKIFLHNIMLMLIIFRGVFKIKLWIFSHQNSHKVFARRLFSSGSPPYISFFVSERWDPTFQSFVKYN